MPRRELKYPNLVPKVKRNEPRDRAHADWAKKNNLVS